MKELEGVCDEVFGKMTESAKTAWVKTYGLTNLIDLVPIFYSSFTLDPIDRMGRQRNLILYINNCLRNELKYGDKPTKLNFDEICK